ncbi:MAG: peptidylprolyl isomerase [Bacteroidota bacterium]
MHAPIHMLFRPLRFVAAGLLLSVGLGTVSTAHAQDESVVDEIVAVVGADIILRSEVDGLVFNALQQRNLPPGTSPADLWRTALGQIVDQKVLTIHAERDTTIIVTEDQIDQSLDQRLQQLSARVGGMEQVEALYGKPVVEIRADLRDELRDQILAEQVQSRKLQQIKITPSEVATWFQQIPADSLPDVPEVVRLSHIVRFPEPTPEAREEALELISNVRALIVSGDSTIEGMARSFSDDGGSASNGGRISEIQLSELVPEFAAVASRVPLGQMSEVFETQFGYHVMRVNERRGDIVDFNHVLIQLDPRKVDDGPALGYLSTLRDSLVTHNASFEMLARRHSEEEFSAQRGGRLVDPRSLERDLILEALGPTWQQTLDTLDVGEISNPTDVALLDGQRGLHIVRLTQRTPPHRMNLQDDYARIEQFALRDKQATELRAWLNGLREDVYIDYRFDPASLPTANSD